MLNHIPTHVISGALGAGKTTFIKDVLAHKPAHERWAVLVNEFGQIGLDAALLEQGQDGVSISEIAGGCLCCVNGAPFLVGLTRLLRKSRPHRLFIEPSGLAHPQAIIDLLSTPTWQTVLTLKPAIMVLDANQPQALNDAQQAVLSTVPYLVLSKAEGFSAAQQDALNTLFADKVIHWCAQAPLPLEWFQDAPFEIEYVDKNQQLTDEKPLPTLWVNSAPICAYNATEQGFSIGWRFSAVQRFSLERLSALLKAQPFMRAKLVVHSDQGVYQANLSQGDQPNWQLAHWNKDSRMEWIFSAPVDKDALTQALMACLEKHLPTAD